MIVQARKAALPTVRLYPTAMPTATAFELAVAHTLGIEGGYSDHPSDRGGKTNWGITEAVARADGFEGAMSSLSKVRALSIYRRLYWDRIGLDWVAAVSPAVAAECFDTGVNMGVAVAVRWLQRILNALNRQGRSWPDLEIDGIAGPATKAALNALAADRGQAGMLTVIAYQNSLQGARYIELAEQRAANEDFIFGWGKRLSVITGVPL